MGTDPRRKSTSSCAGTSKSFWRNDRPKLTITNMAETTTKAEYYVGVDLGGTKILTGVFDDKLNCLGRTKISTKSERGADGVIERISRSVRDVVDECDLDLKQIKGVGIGAPGAVDAPTGRV